MPGASAIVLGMLPPSGSNAALVTFILYTLAVFGLAALSSRLLRKKQFLSEYFLGSRSLGMWAFALTFAATSASGCSITPPPIAAVSSQRNRSQVPSRFFLRPRIRSAEPCCSIAWPRVRAH